MPTQAHRSGIKTWLVSWLLFSILGGLWALASPVLSVPDEPAHAVYAAAAVRGQVWAPAEEDVTTVVLPRDFENVHRVMGCYIFEPNVPAGCAEAFTDRDGEIEIGTLAGRYPPAYYVYAGLGSLVADGANAIYAMRLLTVVLVSALLASAVCSVLARPRPVVRLVGLGLAMTPMLFFFTGAVNPQAPEIATSILLWTSGSSLLLSMRDDPGTSLTYRNADLRRALIALALLPLIRPLSLLWLAVIVVALFLAFGSWTAIRSLLRSRAVLASLPVVAITAGSSLFWVFFRGTLTSADRSPYADLGLPQAFQISVSKLDDNYFQMIGVFGWLSTPAPGLVYALYTLLLGGLVVFTVLQSSARQNLTVALVALAVVVLPVASEMFSYREVPFAWQGRYTLPIAVGVPLLLSVSDGARAFTGRLAKRFFIASATALVTIQALSFFGALNRHVFGISGFWGITPPGWAPPLSYSVLVLGATAVVVVAAVLAYRAPASDNGWDDGMGSTDSRPAAEDRSVHAGHAQTEQVASGAR